MKTSKPERKNWIRAALAPLVATSSVYFKPLRKDSREGHIRKGEVSDPHSNRRESGDKNIGERENSGCSRCGESIKRDPHSQTDQTPLDNSTLRDN